MKLVAEKIGNIACYTLPSFKEDAPVILWIHGYTFNVEVWPDIWKMYPGAHHVAAELPGHGQSGPLNEFSSLQELAMHFITIADHFKARHVAGFSFGGILALQMVIQQPAKFLSLSLISSPVGGKLIDEDAMIRNQLLVKLYHAKGNGPWLTELWVQSPPEIFTGIKKQHEKFQLILKIIQKHQWKELSDNGFSLFSTTNQLVPALGKIDTPVFIYIGEEDMVYIKRCNELLLRRLKSCRRFYVPDCGHLPLLEDPVYLLNLISANINSIERNIIKT